MTGHCLKNLAPQAYHCGLCREIKNGVVYGVIVIKNRESWSVACWRFWGRYWLSWGPGVYYYDLPMKACLGCVCKSVNENLKTACAQHSQGRVPQSRHSSAPQKPCMCITEFLFSLKCKPSATCACATLLIDGLGYLYAFTRSLPLVVYSSPSLTRASNSSR